MYEGIGPWNAPPMQTLAGVVSPPPSSPLSNAGLPDKPCGPGCIFKANRMVLMLFADLGANTYHLGHRTAVQHLQQL
jgi:hypothetical protein